MKPRKLYWQNSNPVAAIGAEMTVLSGQVGTVDLINLDRLVSYVFGALKIVCANKRSIGGGRKNKKRNWQMLLLKQDIHVKYSVYNHGHECCSYA